MKAEVCVYCGAIFHQPYEDGLVECRERLRNERDELLDEVDRLRDALRICGEAGCPTAAINALPQASVEKEEP